MTASPGDDFSPDQPQRATRVDLESPVVAEHLYELYARWRACEPVRRGPLGEWHLTRYDDVAMVLGDPARFRSSLEGTRQYEELISQLRGDAADPVRNVVTDASMLRVDPPDHTRLRRLASKAFTPRAVERLRPRVEQIVDELLDGVGPGSFELMREFAYPLPVTVIAELLGLPASDGELLGRWSRDLLIDSSGLALTRFRGHRDYG